MNYSQIMSPSPPLPRKVGGGVMTPPAPMGAPPLLTMADAESGISSIELDP